MRFKLAIAIILAGLTVAHAADRFAIIQPGQMNAEQKKLYEQGVVDLAGVSGYYAAVSMTLNVAEVPVPDGKPLPLKPLE
ncbi:MAG: hypothetical protein ACXWJ8_02505 [Xanthobacteraceae bacterium]